MGHAELCMPSTPALSFLYWSARQIYWLLSKACKRGDGPAVDIVLELRIWLCQAWMQCGAAGACRAHRWHLLFLQQGLVSLLSFCQEKLSFPGLALSCCSSLPEACSLCIPCSCCLSCVCLSGCPGSLCLLQSALEQLHILSLSCSQSYLRQTHGYNCLQ